jgi:anti-sigma factor RsiW
MNDVKDDNCKDMKELLSAYRDAELDADEHRRVEEHLGSCANCREELAAVESAVKSLRRLAPVELSRDFAEDIESIIKRAESAGREDSSSAVGAAPVAGSNVVPFQRKSNKKLWLAAAAAISISLIAATYFGTTGGGPAVVADNPDQIEKPLDGLNTKPTVKEQIAASENSEVASTPTVDSKVQAAPVEVATTGSGLASVSNDEKPGSSAVKTNPVQGEDTVIAKAPKAQKVTVTPAQSNSGRRAAEIFIDDLDDNEALVALSDTYDDNDIFDGISTDEDGLYAIKM